MEAVDEVNKILSEEKKTDELTVDISKFSPRDKALKYVDVAVENIQRGVTEQDFSLIPRGLRYSYTLRPFLTHNFLLEIFTKYAPKYIPLLESVRGEIPQSEADLAEQADEELKRKEKEEELKKKQELEESEANMSRKEKLAKAKRDQVDSFNKDDLKKSNSKKSDLLKKTQTVPLHLLSSLQRHIPILPVGDYSMEVSHFMMILFFRYLVDRQLYSTALSHIDSYVTSLFSVPEDSHQCPAAVYSMDHIVAAAFHLSHICCLHLDSSSDGIVEIKEKFYKYFTFIIHTKSPESETTLLNILLDSYLRLNKPKQAFSLISARPLAPPQKLNRFTRARYSYYLARIEASEHKYDSALEHVLDAKRLVNVKYGLHFQSAIIKLLSLVTIANGDLPDRRIFNSPAGSLCEAYKQITFAVFSGNVGLFNRIVTDEKNQEQFKNDNLLSLVFRMKEFVLRSAIKRIATCYDHIHISTVTQRLLLDNDLDTDIFISKAVYDNLINASINTETRVMTSKGTFEQQNAQALAFKKFMKRSQMCTKLVDNINNTLKFSEETSN